MAYATYSDVEKRMNKTFGEGEISLCETLLDDAALLIDSYNPDAEDENKLMVSCRMVVRAMANAQVDIPIGASQGSMSALGYSQSWTLTNGATGELYINKTEKRLLGVGSRIGSHSPVEVI